MDHKELMCESVDWIYVVQDRVLLLTCGHEPSDSVKGEKIIV
jgi:hypothetical protein